MRRLATFLSLFLLACGAERAEPPRAQDEAPAPVEPQRPRSDDPGEPPAQDARRMARVVDLPDGPIELPTLPSGTEAVEDTHESPDMRASRYPTVEHPDPAVNAMLSTRLPGLLQRFFEAAEREASSSPVSHVTGRCTASLAHPRLLSVICWGWVSWTRGMPSPVWHAYSFAIEDGELREHSAADSLLPQTELGPMIRASCERTATTEGGGMTRVEACADAPARSVLALGATGLRVLFLPRGHGLQDTGRITIPWAEVDRRVLADSPIGRELAAIEGAEVVEVPWPGQPPGELTEGFSLTELGTLGRTLAAWSRLDLEQRASVRVRFAERPPGSRFDLPPSLALSQLVTDRPAEEAAALGEALGGEVAPTSWRETARPFVGRLRTDANLRDAPFGDPRLSLPAGTVLRGVVGPVGLRDSAIGQRRTWARVAASETIDGFVAGNLIEPHEGCMPDAAAFLDAIPETRRDLARATTIAVMTEVAYRGRRVPVSAWVASTRPGNRRRAGRSRLEIAERTEGCERGDRLNRVDLDGTYFTLGFSHDAPRGGQALVVLATEFAHDGRRRLHWNVMRLRENEPVAAVETPARWTPPTLGHWEGEELILIEYEDYRFAWRDGSLVRD